MKLLSKPFGRPTTEPTKLQAFIDRLDPEQAMKAAREQRHEDLRPATAIALTILMVARDFARSVHESIGEVRVQMGAAKAPSASYDALVFEAAAYCCRQLMRDFLRGSEDDDDDDRASDDRYFEALRDGAHLAGDLIVSHTDFNLPDRFFLNRVISYGLKLKGRPPTELQDFEMVLSCALEACTPAAGRGGRPSLDLALGIALKLNAPTFQSTMIPRLLETSRRLYDHDWV